MTHFSLGTSGNGSYNSYFGAPLNEDIDPQSYNTSAINDSPIGRIARKINYNPLSENDFEGLRNVATLKCLDAKAKRNPCDPASMYLTLNVLFNIDLFGFRWCCLFI